MFNLYDENCQFQLFSSKSTLALVFLIFGYIHSPPPPRFPNMRTYSACTSLRLPTKTYSSYTYFPPTYSAYTYPPSAQCIRRILFPHSSSISWKKSSERRIQNMSNTCSVSLVLPMPLEAFLSGIEFHNLFCTEFGGPIEADWGLLGNASSRLPRGMDAKHCVFLLRMVSHNDPPVPCCLFARQYVPRIRLEQNES